MTTLVHADLRAGACRQWLATLDAPAAERRAQARRQVDATGLSAADRERVARLLAAGAPLLPGERGGWSVYRVVFADGAAYVGITSLPIAERLAQHLGLENSLDPAAPALALRRAIRSNGAILRRAQAGVRYRFRVLASGLDEWQAKTFEDAAIRRLKRPLNRTANARR
ncbi:MAG: hypothetical protein OXG81_13755 [Acidobacteria bacterium]|nr:hypothetical protein [Acidobacteriota bacterium]